MGVYDQLSFFDKIINVTFYDWAEVAEGKTVLRAAFAIHSDNPGFGYEYFRAVLPPGDDVNTITAATLSSIGPGLSDDYFPKGLAKITHYGPKPNIRLTLSMLPETICTQVQLTIEGLTLEIDISNFSLMYIEAGYGYSDGNISLLTPIVCNIFNSYIESPNPAGRTVFTGIVGNWFIKGLKGQPYTVLIDQNSQGYAIADFIAIVCSYIGAVPHVELPAKCYTYKLVIDQTVRERAQNGYQVLDWLSRLLTTMTKQWRKIGLIKEDDYIASTFYDNQLTVTLARTGVPEDKLKVAIDLNRISSASFVGGALTINAPWNPQLIPGKLFTMSPVFFRGRLMPNAALTAVSDKDDFYRPISIDINFETIGPTNTMRVTAIMANLEEYDDTAGKDKTQEDPYVVYRNAQGGTTHMTREQQQAAFQKVVEQDLSRATTAYYYEDELKNAYKVGILHAARENGPSDIDQLFTYRVVDGDRINKTYNNTDVVVHVSAETISQWANLQGGTILSGVTRVDPRLNLLTGPNKQPLFIKEEDPARMDRYSGNPGAWEIFLRENRDFTPRNLDAMLSHLYAVGYLLPRVRSMNKSRVTPGSFYIPIDFVILLLCAPDSYTSFTKSPTHPTLWPGNTFWMIAGADDNTSAVYSRLYPPCSYATGYHILYGPDLSTRNRIIAEIQRALPYLQAVYTFWESWKDQSHIVIEDTVFDASVIYDDAAITTQLAYLKALIYWQRQWPNTPWDFYDINGRKIIV